MAASFDPLLAVDPTFDMFGKAASYTPPGGSATDCVVIVDSADREVVSFAGRPFFKGTVIEVRASEIATPVKGGSFGAPSVSVDARDELAETFEILDDPMTSDPDRLVWRCTVK